MDLELSSLIDKANKVYLENFPPVTNFERAIFFSWGCAIGDCKFCYMSTQPKNKKPRETRRSNESILAEVIISKNLGWDIGFITGGIGSYSEDELQELLSNIHEILNEKVWLSIGPLSKDQLIKFSPYIKGIVGSIETINPELHKKICPSKPIEPYEEMFVSASKLNLKMAMTFIIGLGETKEDFVLLKEFIKKYSINKIHVYSLIPEKNTSFANSKIPSKEEQAWWISNLRINFPKLDIQCGIWEDRIDNIPLLLKSGSNSISKLKAIKLFNSEKAKEIEKQILLSNRKFTSTLTKLPNVDWDNEVNRLNISKELKEKILIKLKNEYLNKLF